MKKPIIGIISQPYGFNEEGIFRKRYYVLDNYTKIIANNNAIPIGILMNDLQVIKESLDMCDGFIITGGILIQDYHLKVIDYAIKNNKPLLGICMGMQALAMYSTKEKVLTKVDNHNEVNHSVNIIDQDSHLYNIFKTNKLEVNSYHNYQVNTIGNNFKIVAKSDDNVIEAIEYKDKNNFIIGVQWHPELLETMQPLIKELIKRSNNEN